MTAIRRSIAAVLRESGDYVSGEKLAGEFGVSRAAVWKHIEALKRDGYSIESGHARGYKLVGTPDRLDRAVAALAGTDGSVGAGAVYKTTTASTNTDAMALGSAGKPHGTIVVAEEQTAGRGRLGRTWESARGVNLYLSILLRPDIAPALAPQLSLLAGVAVAAALEKLGVAAHIKWPNDIVVGGRKLCGILTEIAAETDRVQHVVVGIGVNLNASGEHFPEELRAKATSVKLETGIVVNRGAFLQDLLRIFDQLYSLYERDGFAAIAPGWERRCFMTGRRVDVDGVGGGKSLSGTCMGIDAEGALLVDVGEAQPVRIIAGDVTLQGSYA